MTRRMPLALALAASVMGAAALGQAPTAADLARLGPAVGQPVPSFSLPDQFGRTRELASLLRRNGAMLVFFRSADW